MPGFQVKLGTNDLNCVDVPLNPTHSLTYCPVINMCAVSSCGCIMCAL